MEKLSIGLCSGDHPMSKQKHTEGNDMTDLSQITTPFGLLDEATKDALTAAWESGAQIEYYRLNGWVRIDHPNWRVVTAYRVKERPVRVCNRKTFLDGNGNILGYHWVTSDEDGTDPTVTWEAVV
jgi:hypothetical protein